MNDGVDVLECPANGFAVADITNLELDLRVEIVGPLPGRVNLRIEVVERPNLVPFG